MADQNTKRKDSFFPRRYKPMDDYTVQVQLDSRGRERQVPVYIGPYLLPQHSDEQYRTFRIAVIICAALILGASFVLLFFNTYAVYRYEGLYTLIPLTIALFPFAYLLIGFFRMPRANGRMQRDVYGRSVRRIRRSSMAVAICAALSLILWLVFLIAIHFTGLTWWDGLYTGMMLLILACGLFLFFYDKTLTYEFEAAEAPHDLQDAMNARTTE